MTTRIDDQRTLGDDGQPLPETSAPYAAKVLAERLIEYGPDELAPYHRNPRRGDVDAIAASLRRNGQYRPIVVNLGTLTGRPLEVLAGNHTLAAARQLGWDRIAATTVDVDDHAAARIVAADNRTADLGDYNTDVLVGLLQELDGLEGTGYDDDDLAAMLDTGEAADLDALADEWDGTGMKENIPLTIKVLDLMVRERWQELRDAYDSDDETLAALLDSHDRPVA